MWWLELLGVIGFAMFLAASLPEAGPTSGQVVITG
jgi:hypothetical protein